MLKQIIIFLIGAGAFRFIVRMLEVEPRKNAKKPRFIIAYFLAAMDNLINLILLPFGLRKRRSWRTSYAHWTENKEPKETAA